MRRRRPLGQAAIHLRVRRDPKDRPGQRLGVARAEEGQPLVVPEEVGQGRMIRGDEGRPARQGLNGRLGLPSYDSLRVGTHTTVAARIRCWTCALDTLPRKVIGC